MKAYRARLLRFDEDSGAPQFDEDGLLVVAIGVVFFVLDSRVRYAHAVWHLFVAAGTGFHFFAVLDYSA